MNGLLLALLILLQPEAAFTSQEGMLALSSFEVRSVGIGTSGPVSVHGSQDKAGHLQSLALHAFGKKISVPAALLEKVPPGFNGIHLSYEGGFKSLGGRTVYIVFVKAFTSGEKETLVVVVKESGSSSVIRAGGR